MNSEDGAYSILVRVHCQAIFRWDYFVESDQEFCGGRSGLWDLTGIEGVSLTPFSLQVSQIQFRGRSDVSIENPLHVFEDALVFFFILHQK
jgi:hypothetical protein